MAPPVGSCQDLRAAQIRRQRIIMLTERDWKAAEIARELGVNRRTVERHRADHQAGRPPRGAGNGSRRISQERWARIIELTALGWSNSQISAELRINARTVRRYRARHRDRR